MIGDIAHEFPHGDYMSGFFLGKLLPEIFSRFFSALLPFIPRRLLSSSQIRFLSGFPSVGEKVTCSIVLVTERSLLGA
jgi:hypothetical protein